MNLTFLKFNILFLFFSTYLLVDVNSFASQKFEFLTSTKTNQPPFQIIQKDNVALKIKLGDMPFNNNDKVDLAIGFGSKLIGTVPTSYTVTYISSSDGDNSKIVLNEKLNNSASSDNKYYFPINSNRLIKVDSKKFKKTGVYQVSVMCVSGELNNYDNILPNSDGSELFYEEYNCWNQDIFIYSKTDYDKIKKIDHSKIANTFAPILNFAKNEQYFPSSLSYIFNRTNPFPSYNKKSSSLNTEKIIVSNKNSSTDYKFEKQFLFEELFDVMKFYGDKNFLMSAGYQGGLGFNGYNTLGTRFGDGFDGVNTPAIIKPVIYYSLIPSLKNSENNLYYLNYHFFYSYDSKGGEDKNVQGKTGAAGHAFDRESITVKLMINNNQSIAPLSVIYGAHLPNQTMAYLDANNKPKTQWEGGAVEVPWSEVQSKFDNNINSNRPETFIAHGSHGIYPKMGNYAVRMLGINALIEPAGNGNTIYPPGFNGEKNKDLISNGNYELNNGIQLSSNYKLLDLGLLDYKIEYETAVLNFSGSWVTIFFDKPDATFPPFTNREVNPDDYSIRAHKPGEKQSLKLKNW